MTATTAAVGDGPRAIDPDRIAWDKLGGLVPAIVQHAVTGCVLMLGFMNREALQATLARGRVVFFSRSRGRLWEKGETSGHSLTLVGLRLDCDADTLLISAEPSGPVCHTGTASCFGDQPLTDAARHSFLFELERVIDQRVTGGGEGSYTARLYQSGLRRMAQKVGEEGLETALAAVGEPDAQLIGESADLVYHLLVLLRARGLALQNVVAELERRHRASCTATVPDAAATPAAAPPAGDAGDARA